MINNYKLSEYKKNKNLIKFGFLSHNDILEYPKGNKSGGHKMAEEIVELEKTGEIVLPKIDVKKFIGTKAKIVRITEQKGQHGFFVKLQTEVLEVITGGKDPINISASRIFGLQEDDKSNIGWGKDTKLGVFLTKMKVKHYKDLEGVEVIVQSTTNKDGVDYLTFN